MWVNSILALKYNMNSFLMVPNLSRGGLYRSRECVCYDTISNCIQHWCAMQCSLITCYLVYWQWVMIPYQTVFNIGVQCIALSSLAIWCTDNLSLLLSQISIQVMNWILWNVIKMTINWAKGEGNGHFYHIKVTDLPFHRITFVSCFISLIENTKKTTILLRKKWAKLW